jgi:hypothetical protein
MPKKKTTDERVWFCRYRYIAGRSWALIIINADPLATAQAHNFLARFVRKCQSQLTDESPHLIRPIEGKDSQARIEV